MSRRGRRDPSRPCCRPAAPCRARAPRADASRERRGGLEVTPLASSSSSPEVCICRTTSVMAVSASGGGAMTDRLPRRAGWAGVGDQRRHLDEGIRLGSRPVISQSIQTISVLARAVVGASGGVWVGHSARHGAAETGVVLAFTRLVTTRGPPTCTTLAVMSWPSRSPARRSRQAGPRRLIPGSARPDPRERRGGIRRWLLTGVVVVGFALAALATAAYFHASLGVVTALLGVALAVIPVGIVVPTFLWLDRFEAEPTLSHRRLPLGRARRRHGRGDLQLLGAAGGSRRSPIRAPPDHHRDGRRPDRRETCKGCSSSSSGGCAGAEFDDHRRHGLCRDHHRGFRLHREHPIISGRPTTRRPRIARRDLRRPWLVQPVRPSDVHRP